MSTHAKHLRRRADEIWINVAPAVWEYEVSGKQVIKQWFSYRKRNRERLLMGDRRLPSALSNVQPDA